MVLPDESYLRVAHEHDPSLQEYAWSSNVILASPSTLMDLLRTVATTWQQETVAESAREVSELGRELYKRLATMGAPLRRSSARSLDGAVDAYNKTVGSLERQVLVQARRFEQHGISGIEPPEIAAGRAPDPVARRRRELVDPHRRRSRPCRQAPTPPEPRNIEEHRCVLTLIGGPVQRARLCLEERPVSDAT